ncbi:hypothetical protein D3C71_1681740 [compost metagenome]
MTNALALSTTAKARLMVKLRRASDTTGGLLSSRLQPCARSFRMRVGRAAEGAVGNVFQNSDAPNRAAAARPNSQRLSAYIASTAASAGPMAMASNSMFCTSDWQCANRSGPAISGTLFSTAMRTGAINTDNRMPLPISAQIIH